MPKTPHRIPTEVFAAAKSVVGTLGPGGLTMENLVRETGLSRTTLYRRTGGREALLDALQEAGLPIGDRTEARSRILQSARSVFSRTGFSGATSEAIATEAHVSLATVYRHFGDKEGLAAAVLEELAPRRALRDAAPTSDVRADLVRVAQRMLGGLAEDTPLVRWMLIETLQGGPFLPRVRALPPTRSLLTLTRLFSSHLASGRLPDSDPRLLAQAFAGMVMAFGVIGPIFNQLPVPDPSSTAREIADLFLHGALGSRKEIRTLHGRR